MKLPFRQSARVPALLAGGLLGLAIPAHAAVIYSQNFEGAGFVLADNSSVSGWGTGFTSTAYLYRLNPAGTGSSWLNPVPTELGTTFAIVARSGTTSVNTGQTFVLGQQYELTFTNFRRDDVDGVGITVSIGDSAGASFSQNFDAVTTTDTYVTRSFTYTATASDVGDPIYLRFSALGTASNSFQAGIDNISLATIPEPSAFALFGIASVAGVFTRRRSRGHQ